MLTSYWVTCPRASCGWTGSVLPSIVQGGPDTEIVSMNPAWFRCPRCQADWEVQITDDRVTVLPASERRGKGELAHPLHPAAVPNPAPYSSTPWRRAQKLIQKIEAHLPLEPEIDGNGVAALQIVLEQLPGTFEALRQTHAAHDELLAARTAEMSEANASLRDEIAAGAQAKRRLNAEHAVGRILTESTQLTQAAALVLQSISEASGWDGGALWSLDREAELLRCVEVWQGPMVDMAVFERACREHTLSRGIGLPGRVWASNNAVWIPDVTQDASFPRAAVAARAGLHAAVGFPIGSDEFLGVVEFFGLQMRQPDKELLDMMASIGGHIGEFMQRIKREEALLRKETELRIAKEIQAELVPKAPPTLAGLDVAGASYSAVETGGDYFDFLSLIGSALGVAIGDASGHGLGPALLITETRAYLRAFARTSEDPARTMALVNCRLAEDVGDNFVTLFFARLDPRTRSFVYTSAGHPTGCIVGPLGNVNELLKSTGFPLGIAPDGDFPIGPAITLQSGDLVLLLTDGVIDATAPDGTVFGFQRALDIVRVYRRDPAAQIVDNLYHAVRAFSHGNTQVDDITAVVIKVGEVTSPNESAWALPDDPVVGAGLAPNGAKDNFVATLLGPERSGFLGHHNEGVSPSEDPWRDLGGEG